MGSAVSTVCRRVVEDSSRSPVHAQSSEAGAARTVDAAQQLLAQAHVVEGLEDLVVVRLDRAVDDAHGRGAGGGGLSLRRASEREGANRRERGGVRR